MDPATGGRWIVRMLQAGGTSVLGELTVDSAGAAFAPLDGGSAVVIRAAQVEEVRIEEERLSRRLVIAGRGGTHAAFDLGVLPEPAAAEVVTAARWGSHDIRRERTPFNRLSTQGEQG